MFMKALHKLQSATQMWAITIVIAVHFIIFQPISSNFPLIFGHHKAGCHSTEREEGKMLLLPQDY